MRFASFQRPLGTYFGALTIATSRSRETSSALTKITPLSPAWVREVRRDVRIEQATMHSRESPRGEAGDPHEVVRRTLVLVGRLLDGIDGA